MSGRGRLWTERWISCGVCRKSSQLEVPSHARKEAERLGWKWGIKSAWVCPECLRARGET